MTVRPMPSISLLHATFHAIDPVAVRETWLARARYRDHVEHIFALDADDDESASATQGYRRVIGPPGDGVVTSVRNWNAAAAEATGDLLFVIADDLLPPSDWDVALRHVISGLDPLQVAFAVKIGDGDTARDSLLRHPVVSRRFYTQYGLFSRAFRGVFCDNDISIRAFRSAVIIDGRRVRFLHGHPQGHTAPVTLSKGRLNQPQEFDDGLAALSAMWTRRQREAPRILLRVKPAQQLSSRQILAIRGAFMVLSTILYPAKLARAKLLRQRLLTDPPLTDGCRQPPSATL